ncbi:MAG: type II secretion system protein [bacterium]|nr:type II secretion system protein [bacterium]
MNKQRGFTLIELLIVIVVLGILAVAILSAINPIEQINKANDAGTQSDSAEFINASERYFASNQKWPWESADPVEAIEPEGAAYTQVSSLTGSLAVLTASDEVKSEFVTRASMAKIYIQLRGTGSSQYLRACFEPSSQTFKNNTKQFDATIVLYTGAVGGGFCVPGVL